MLLLYDNSDWSTFSWSRQAVVVRAPGNLKWWFVKRFLWPGIVNAYDYLAIIDDDVELPPNFNFVEMINLIRRNDIHVAQPALLPSSRNIAHSVTVWKNFTQIPFGAAKTPSGRWTDFVQSGPFTIFQRDTYQKCIWPSIAEDLTSGSGLDRIWFSECKEHGLSRFAMCAS
jgi:hypothetical protein